MDEDSLTGGAYWEVVLVEVGWNFDKPIGVLKILVVLPLFFSSLVIVAWWVVTWVALSAFMLLWPGIWSRIHCGTSFLTTILLRLGIKVIWLSKYLPGSIEDFISTAPLMLLDQFASLYYELLNRLFTLHSLIILAKDYKETFNYLHYFSHKKLIFYFR